MKRLILTLVTLLAAHALWAQSLPDIAPKEVSPVPYQAWLSPGGAVKVSLGEQTYTVLGDYSLRPGWAKLTADNYEGFTSLTVVGDTLAATAPGFKLKRTLTHADECVLVTDLITNTSAENLPLMYRQYVNLPKVKEYRLCGNKIYSKRAAGTNSIIGRYSREAPYGPDAAGDFPDLKRDGAIDEPVVWGVNGLRNVRDIGGWTGLKTGMVYRGSKLVRADVFADGVDPETRRVVRDVWHLASDVDLRGKSEYGPAKTNLVELQSMGVPKLAFPIRAYEHIFDKPKLFGDVLRALARPEAYPAYIHCSGGADRTGTLVFVLEALCGVPEADLDVDYELTSFASVFGMRDRNEILTISLRRLKERFRRYPGATLNECVENACVDAFGLTREEIASIRRILKPSN